MHTSEGARALCARTHAHGVHPSHALPPFFSQALHGSLKQFPLSLASPAFPSSSSAGSVVRWVEEGQLGDRFSSICAKQSWWGLSLLSNIQPISSPLFFTQPTHDGTMQMCLG